jgi:CheY-like chemotaxis protein
MRQLNQVRRHGDRHSNCVSSNLERISRYSTVHWWEAQPQFESHSEMKILLVDDDELVRAVLADILMDAGYDVVETGDPQNALGLLAAISPPGFLVTDVDLRSSLTGFDVAVGAHCLCPTIQVILISALSADHTGQPLDARDRYLQKPFTGARLLGVISQLLNDVSLHRYGRV